MVIAKKTWRKTALFSSAILIYVAFALQNIHLFRDAPV